MARRKHRIRMMPSVRGTARGRLVRLLKLAWWSVCLGVLVWWFIAVEPGTLQTQASEPVQHQTLKGVMALLAFPAGLLWVWSMPWLVPAAQAVGLPMDGWPWYAPTVMARFGCALLGYAQWFWLLPHVFTLRASDS